MSDRNFRILSILAGLIGIVSLPLSIFFWLESKSYPNLILVAQPVRATLVSSKIDPTVTISHQGESIKGPVTAIQIAVWNSGTKEIRHQDILQPVVISLTPPAKIIAAEIRKLTRPITGLTIDKSKFAQGSLSLTWQILESSDGGILQITYIGDESVDASASGIITGQKTLQLQEGIQIVRPVKSNLSIREPWWRRFFSPYVDAFIYWVPFILIVVVISMISRRYKHPAAKIVYVTATGISAIFAIIVISFVLIVGAGLVYSAITAPPTPPFNF